MYSFIEELLAAMLLAVMCFPSIFPESWKVSTEPHMRCLSWEPVSRSTEFEDVSPTQQ